MTYREQIMENMKILKREIEMMEFLLDDKREEYIPVRTYLEIRAEYRNNIKFMANMMKSYIDEE